MKYFYYILFFLQPYFLFQQSQVYYKSYDSPIGSSAISINTLTAKTYSFTLPVYKIVTDTSSGNLFISTRQKDVTGKNYTNKGFHLILKRSDTICCLLEDTKLDLALAGDRLVLSNDNRSSRFNRTFGYEQFEYPSKIIYPIAKNNSGLTYNPAFKINNEQGLSCINLNDGTLIWSALIPVQYDWNGVSFLNDSVLVIAAGGLHAVNINKGLIWSYPLATAQKSNRPYTYSAFNHVTTDKYYTGISTSHEDGQATQIASNILVTDSAVYFASKDKLIALDRNGKLMWEANVSSLPMSNCLLQQNGDNVLLMNLGIARYNDNLVLCGAPFIAGYNKHSGTLTLSNKQDVPDVLSDIGSFKRSRLMAGKNKVIEITEDLKVTCMVDLPVEKFGRFLEFVDGNDYFVEKEGFYVPLNFINDNVIYFKSDHGKVFGMNSNNIEYEYHFTELYKLNKTIGNKKLISQKNKSLLISENFELLHSFNIGEPAIYHNEKIYFPDGRLLYVIDVNSLR